ncbi:MAG: family 43 glycosylhydrolase [Acidobacteria bacterium]|nr:family 43 glycosylhydrolase [Acidobacteriota bacterium]
MNIQKLTIAGLLLLATIAAAYSQPYAVQPRAFGKYKLEDVRMRDTCILVDEKTQTYYAISSTQAPPKAGFRRASVQAYTSKDLITWKGPTTIFQAPADLWGDTNILSVWAPEMHLYKGKYYLFLTFDTDEKLGEQWRDWLPRVKRGSQILVADSPLGPFKPFENRSTLPPDMMTLDATLWVEDGVPYTVFAHEWVQIKDGTIEYVRLKDDLSGIVGEPKRLFNASDAVWSVKNPDYGCHVTDGPWLYRSKTGKLLMVWSSFSTTGYTVGIARSESGKLAGPWIQQAEPIYSKDGGHPMLFKRLDGQLMMSFHSPNKGGLERTKLFEMDDLGDTLRIKGPFLASK